jgi:hypothetical protein
MEKVFCKNAGKRRCLILTDDRVIYRGIFKIFDSELSYKDIIDVIIESNSEVSIKPILKIRRKNGPTVKDVLFQLFNSIFRFFPDYGSGYSIACNWLSSDEIVLAYNYIKEKIK